MHSVVSIIPFRSAHFYFVEFYEKKRKEANSKFELFMWLDWSFEYQTTNKKMISKNDQQSVKIKICGTQIKSKSFINVLGVTFDSKLNWSVHVSNAIAKAKKSLYALRQLKPYFSNSQMRLLVECIFTPHYIITPQFGSPQNFLIP